jgi:hypothetical protein
VAIFVFNGLAFAKLSAAAEEEPYCTQAEEGLYSPEEAGVAEGAEVRKGHGLKLTKLMSRRQMKVKVVTSFVELRLSTH